MLCRGSHETVACPTMCSMCGESHPSTRCPHPEPHRTLHCSYCKRTGHVLQVCSFRILGSLRPRRNDRAPPAHRSPPHPQRPVHRPPYRPDRRASRSDSYRSSSSRSSYSPRSSPSKRRSSSSSSSSSGSSRGHDKRRRR
jgi:hypothetical protein